MPEEKNPIFGLPAISDLEKARSDVKTAEAFIEKAQERMYQAILTLPLQIGENTEFSDYVIADLYWFAADIPTKWLAEAFGLRDYDIRQIAGKASLSIKCQSCGNLLTVSGRTELQEIRRGCNLVCNSCNEAERREREKRWKEENAAEETRLRELQTMPYPEYLKIPEWESRKAQHLKSTGYRCQVCNSSNIPLHVHHRTYERRGYENFKDLIVLCEECHRLYHEKGKLPADE